jgi:hypothetical protein
MMALKKKRTIMLKNPQLRRIRVNLRRLIISASKAEQAKIHDKKEKLREIIDFYENENLQKESKELNDKYWAIETPLRASIMECPVCFKSDKDMTYNPVRKTWYCTDCYEVLQKGNIERGTPEEFP